VTTEPFLDFDIRLAKIVSDYEQAGLIKLAANQSLQVLVDTENLLKTDVSPVVKNSEQLFREYELEKWGKELARVKSLLLVKDLSLDEVYSPTPKNLTIRIFDQLFETELVIARKLFIECLADFVSNILPDISSILDVGSGTGATLLPLLERLPSVNVPIYATDISPSGLEVLKMISAAADRIITTATHDFSSGLKLNLDIPEGSLVITSFSLSCIPKIPTKFFEDLVNLEPEFVLHIESLYETLDPSSELDRYAQKYIEWNRYNQNLMSELEVCIGENPAYDLIYQSSTFFGQNPSFPLSIVLWGRVSEYGSAES
jgi:SAM-dependent methyltransferase